MACRCTWPRQTHGYLDTLRYFQMSSIADTGYNGYLGIADTQYCGYLDMSSIADTGYSIADTGYLHSPIADTLHAHNTLHKHLTLCDLHLQTGSAVTDQITHSPPNVWSM